MHHSIHITTCFRKFAVMPSLFRITGQQWQLLQLIWTYLENPKIYSLHNSTEH